VPKRPSGSPSVLHLADYGGAYSGNFVASLRSLVEPSRALGLRVVFGFSDIAKGLPFLDDLRAQGLPVHLLPKTASLRDRTSAVGQLARAENAALYHTHFYRWDVPAALAAAGSSRTPQVVWHLHSPIGNRSIASQAKEAFKLRLLGRRARVAAVSEAILSEVIGWGFPSNRASYIPNGIDLARATARSAGRDALRRELAIPPGGQVVLAFGWDPLRKGVDVALDAFASLATRGDVEVVLVVVGTDDLQTLLEKRFAGGFPSWLRFLRPREHVGDLYAATDVFLSASRVEGFPYALGEALANGLPVVISDIPGCEWAREIEGTRFFPSGDGTALAEAVLDVARWTPERRAVFGRAGRALAEARLSLGAWAARVAGLYERAVAEG
jgi:glycosyltransferase involved in cell wall biosynthesis